MVIKFLGTSSGKAIPRAGCSCAQCQSKDPWDKRTRSSILINSKILVDCGPDILRQIKNLKFKIKNLRYIFITHRHDDHIAGINDLQKKNNRIKIIYLRDNLEIKIDNLVFKSICVPHSKKIKTYELAISHKPYAISNLVYIPDFSKITSTMLKQIKRSKIVILDGSMLSRNFGGHLAIKNQIELFKPYTLNLKPIIYYTHNGHTHIPHQKLEEILQSMGGRHFHLAYDKMKIRL